MDLLAGLQSQSDDDDEEIPDWLSNLTGDAGASKKSQPGAVENRRVELGGPSKPAREPEDELPSWLSSLSASTASADDRGEKEQSPADDAPTVSPFGAFADIEPPTQAEEAGADWLTSLQSDASISEDAVGSDTDVFASVDLPDWMKADETPAPAPDTDAVTSDWLKSLDGQAAPETPSAPDLSEPVMDTVDWLKTLDTVEEPPAPAPAAAESTDFDMPDWLKSMGDAPAAAPTPAAAPEASADSDFFMPDWLKGADEIPAAAPSAPAAPEPASAPMDFETPDWLKGVEPTAADTSAAADFDMPDWLKGASEPAQQPQTPSSDFSVDIPVWLKSAKMETDEPAKARPFAAAEPSAPSAPSGPAFVPAFTDFSMEEASVIDTPDWLANLGKTPEPSNLPTPETSMPSPIPEDMDSEFTSEPLAGDLDALFTDMPDWLNSASMTPSAGQQPSVDETDAEKLSPASLPSWVQAMRPVDTASNPLLDAAAGETMETRGPFAGLQGVLPSATYLGASSKPKALAIKLQADDEQQSQALLLEQIMAAEAHPEPMITPAGVNSQRILRIAIFVLLLAVVTGAIFMGTQIFPLPLGRPAETMAAFNIVDAVIPPDAPVLVVFDYEPALAGEMEAVAAPLLDHLVVKNHPRMALLSTSPTGAVMAARMFSGPLGELPAIQYVNLGYLPGGLSSVRAFAQDPTHTLVLPPDVSVFNLAPASVWDSPTLQGVQSFSNFAAIILITDSVDAGRTWIEQAGPLRGNAQFVVISSAQAGPLLQPYYASGQINGLASGLYDAAVLEQNNAGRPGTARRYWDAYSLGLVLILVLLVGGALWSLAANLRERIASKEAG